MTFSSTANVAYKDTRVKLMQAYAESIGAIRFTQKVTDYISAQCQFPFSITESVLNSVDYQIRHKVGYNYLEFIDFIGVDGETNRQAEDVAKMLITEHAGCSNKQLSVWYRESIEPLVNSEHEKLKGLETLFGLPKINRSESKLVKYFTKKLDRFNMLSNDEVSSLATALESGFYHYSLLSDAKVDKNLELALTLREYLVEKTADPKLIYQLAQTQSLSSRTKALEYFKLSAEKGYVKAQMWLGTYYACDENKIEALFWLNKAALEDAKTVNLIKLEIQDLGVPTNCYEGWVH